MEFFPEKSVTYDSKIVNSIVSDSIKKAFAISLLTVIASIFLSIAVAQR